MRSAILRCDPPELMSIEDLEMYTGFSKSYIYQHLKDKIGYKKEGKNIFFDLEDVRRYFKDKPLIKKKPDLQRHQVRRTSVTAPNNFQ